MSVETLNNLISEVKEAEGTVVSTKQIRECLLSKGYTHEYIDLLFRELIKGGYRICRGKYDLSGPVAQPVQTTVITQPTMTFTLPTNSNNQPKDLSHLIPAVDKNFIKFGNYSTIEKIVASREFMPTWITGLSGNGKTYSVEQAAANTNTPIIMVNVTNETNEEDLIGTFSLETTNSYEVEVDEALLNEFLKAIV